MGWRQGARELAVGHQSGAMLWMESQGEAGSLQALSVSPSLLLFLSKIRLAPLPVHLSSAASWG